MAFVRIFDIPFLASAAVKCNIFKAVMWSGVFLLVVFWSAVGARADGIVSRVTSAPVFPNGIVRDVRAGINIFLQSEAMQGEDFLNPSVLGYGIPAGGRMEVEMLSGYQRDQNIPLDERAILLVVGTPQQGLPADKSGFLVFEGSNPNTFVIKPKGQGGLPPASLVSPVKGAVEDPVRQRGIKIVHVGRVSAFVSRGEKGVVAVRIIDGEGNVISSGRGEVAFLNEPAPQVFPTNIPHDQRNHNFQRLETGQVVGVARDTLPIPVILYARNSGLGTEGIEGAGVLSRQQLTEAGVIIPDALQIYNGGLIFRDADGDGLLNPGTDRVIGGVTIDAPEGAEGHQLLTPLVSEKPFLSVHTGKFNERAGENIGGAIMQTVFIAGNVPGNYRIGFAMLDVPGDFETATEPKFHYTIIVE